MDETEGDVTTYQVWALRILAHHGVSRYVTDSDSGIGINEGAREVPIRLA